MPTWQIVVEVAKAVGALLLGTAALVSACAARRGLRTWERQLVGTARWDVARRLLRQVYAVRDSLQFRWPISDAQRRIQAAVSDLQVAAHEAEALRERGQEVTEALAPIRRCANDMSDALEYYGAHRPENECQEEEMRAHDGEFDHAAKIIFPSRKGEDPFADQLSAAVASAENLTHRWISRPVR
jgi:hypothetical protein